MTKNEEENLTCIIPPSYVRKLEDLEKITGHIVIQRFFTKTDHIFGSWIEKQLGMTTKTVAVDTAGLIQPEKIREVEDFSRTNTNTVQRTEYDFSTSCDDDSYVNRKGSNSSSGWMEDFQKANGGNKIIKKKAPRDRSNIDEEILMELLRHVEKHPSSSLTSLNESSGAKIEEDKKEAGNFTQEDTDGQVFRAAKRVEHRVSSLGTNLSELEKEIIPNEVADNFSTEKNSDGSLEEDKGDEKSIKSLMIEPVKTPRSFSIVDECLGSSPILQTQNEHPNEKSKHETQELASKETANELSNIQNPEESIKIPEAAIVTENLIDKNETKPNFSPILQSTKDSSDMAETVVLSEATNNPEIGNIPELNHPILKENENLKSQPELSEMKLHARQIDSISADSCLGTEENYSSSNYIQSVISSSRLSEELNPLIPEAEEKIISENGSPSSSHFSVLDDNIPPGQILCKSDQEEEDNDSINSLQNKDEECYSECSSRRLSHGSFSIPAIPEESHNEDLGDLDEFDSIIATHRKRSGGLVSTRRIIPRNMSTQTTRSIEESTIGSSATSDGVSSCNEKDEDDDSSSVSSYELEVVSKKIVTTTSNTKVEPKQSGRSAYLPSGASSLNLLNMKFSVGKDFESEVSIRMATPNVGKSRGIYSNANAAGVSSGGADELHNLWTNVKGKMESKLEKFPLPSKGLQVKGTGMKLVDSSGNTNENIDGTFQQQDRIKRSLLRLNKLLDDN